jgi:phosphatidylglycerol lysyltransferase
MDAARLRVLSLLRRHGWNSTSFQVLEEGFRYAFDDEADACVAYVQTGGAWVVAGTPIAEPDVWGRVVERFLAKARDAKRRVAFFAVEERFLGTHPLSSVHIGEQPTWDPALWDATVRQARSLREQLRRARAKGVVVRSVRAYELTEPGAPLRGAVDALIARWLASHTMAPLGFLVDVQPFDFPEERRYFVAEKDGHAVAFLAAVPVYARSGWLLEDLLRDPSAPNGTAEALVDFAMRSFATDDARYVTMGLAPLAGAKGWLGVAREWSRALYDFDGVRAFKAKLRPQRWEPIYLAYPPGASVNVALVDALAAFARGSFARYGADTLLHGPAIVVRALGAMLIPWTLLLALAPAPWFPSAWLKVAWVLFDVALAAGLLALAVRWTRWLGRGLAAVVTIDAALTWVEVIAWNVPRAHGAADWIVASIACAAPSAAATILWSAHALRSREIVRFRGNR